MERTSFGVILGLWAAGLGAAAQFGKLSVTYPMLGDIYGEGTALGFAVSLVGFVGVVFGVTAGLVVARIGPRRALILALLLGALVSGFQAGLPALPLFLASRVVEGASHLAIVVAAPTLIAQLSAPRHRGLTLSLWSTFFGVAFAVMTWVGVPLVQAAGVGALYGAHAVWMAAMAGLVAVLLPRDVVGPRGPRLTLAEIAADHVAIYRSPFTNAAALGWVCYAGAFVAILTVMPPFLPDDARGAVVGAMPLAGIACSMTLGVWLLKRVPAPRVAVAGFLLSLLCGIAVWAAPGQGWPYLALSAALGLVQGSSFASIPQLNPDPAAQAQANGALAQMGNVGTTCGTPVLAAMVGAGGIGGFLVFASALFAGGAVLHLLTAQAETPRSGLNVPFMFAFFGWRLVARKLCLNR